jgi:predicted DNA-binding protein (MmcQ/YjbR family)
MSFDALRRHCAALPGATRDIKWGADEVYSVGAKMFAVFGIEGAKVRGASFKVDPERFLELTDRPGLAPAPYLARAHWVFLERSDALPLTEARALLSRSHELVMAKLTRKLRESITGGQGPRNAARKSRNAPDREPTR